MLATISWIWESTLLNLRLLNVSCKLKDRICLVLSLFVGGDHLDSFAGIDFAFVRSVRDVYYPSWLLYPSMQRPVCRYSSSLESCSLLMKIARLSLRNDSQKKWSIRTRLILLTLQSRVTIPWKRGIMSGRHKPVKQILMYFYPLGTLTARSRQGRFVIDPCWL